MFTSTLDGVRNADLEAMVRVLERQQAAKLDIVAPSTTMKARGGLIEIAGADPIVDDDGVTTVNGLYTPTGGADRDLATRLGIPTRYLHRLRAERPDLYDANINGLIHGTIDPTMPNHYAAHDKSYLLRCFRSVDSHEPGILRAVLSDRYSIVDHLDVLTAVLDGIRQAGVRTQVRSCDVTPTTMHVKVYSPDIAGMAPRLLRGYRNPFPHLNGNSATAASGGDRPVVFAGFRCSNCETGDGAVLLKPEILVRVCSNGLTLPALAVREVHLGAKLRAGQITWSPDTHRKQLALITAKARDCVTDWLSPEFLTTQVDELDRLGNRPVHDPQQAITSVGRELGFTEAERAGVLSHFIAAAQPTAAGIANAITSYSQTIPDADRADALDDLAVAALQTL